MGNRCGSIIAKTNDTLYTIYDKYYPKYKFLHPIYVSSAGMLAVIGYQMINGRTLPPVAQCHCRNFAYLTGIGASIGMHTWMHFFDAPTGFQLLPRHQFGLLQRSLLPKYMFLVTYFSFASLLAFLKHNPWGTWIDQKHTMGMLLGASFLLNIVNFTCFSVNTVKYDAQMHEIEKGAGAGLNVVGMYISDNKLEENADYVRSRSKFHHFHALGVIASLLSYSANIGQMYLISKNFTF